MREIALHLLDIAENSVAAKAKNIRIEVSEDLVEDRLWACVQDDGRGMDAETVKRVIDPFYTTRTTRKVGLGIPLFKDAAEMAAGDLTLQSEPGKGTRLEVRFQHSHIDRMPLGDIAMTFRTLLISYPHIHWVFRYQIRLSPETQAEEFLFDDTELKAELGDVPLTEPEVLAFVRQLLEEGIDELAHKLIV
jgi:anti-sigma regulatory factor (Ser/Thr protein kinase)